MRWVLVLCVWTCEGNAGTKPDWTESQIVTSGVVRGMEHPTTAEESVCREMWETRADAGQPRLTMRAAIAGYHGHLPNTRHRFLHTYSSSAHTSRPLVEQRQRFREHAKGTHEPHTRNQTHHVRLHLILVTEATTMYLTEPTWFTQLASPAFAQLHSITACLGTTSHTDHSDHRFATGEPSWRYKHSALVAVCTHCC